MNNLSKKLTDMLTPFLAVIAYKSSYTNEFYLEERKIDSKGKMGAGVPMKEKTIGNIMGALAVDSVGFEAALKAGFLQTCSIATLPRATQILYGIVLRRKDISVFLQP